MNKIFALPSIAFPKNQKNNLFVWIGTPFFPKFIEQLGWRVITQPYNLAKAFTWDDIVEFTNGEIPAVLFVADASTSPLVLGVKNFPCLTMFYSVDSHIHSWQPLYAQEFDFCLVSLKDNVRYFCTGAYAGQRTYWSPPYCHDLHTSTSEVPKKYDLLFVGRVNKDINPKRYFFLQELKQAFPNLHISMDGSWPKLFPQAKLVVNECALGDLNFRVMEALACGTCLLTPQIENGLDELFTVGKDLFTYPAYDISALVRLVKKLLLDEETIKRVSQSGKKAVLSKHLASHRAGAISAIFTDTIISGDVTRIIAARLQLHTILASQLRLFYLQLANTTDAPMLKEQYLHAAMH